MTRTGNLELELVICIKNADFNGPNLKPEKYPI